MKYEELKLSITSALFWISGALVIIFACCLDSKSNAPIVAIVISTIVNLICYYNIDLYVKREENREKCWRIHYGGKDRR